MNLAELYAEGLSLREVGKKAGLSCQTVHRRLRRLNVKMRRRGAPELLFGARKMAAEIEADLKGKFGDTGATLPELTDWLGDEAVDILRALRLLIKEGRVAIVARETPGDWKGRAAP